MAIGTVQELGRSRAGKPTVKVDGKLYFAGKCNIDGLQVGSKIDFTSNSFTTDSGKELWGLQSWKPVSNGAAPAQHSPTALDDADRPFISNVVAHAIQAGHIKTPAEIAGWARAAQRALRLLKSTEPDLDDELPERFYGAES